jgi:uncharacterized protein
LRLLADAMLGKHARWLRMIGQDVTYSVGYTDNELLDLAKKENRMLLTRDFELHKQAICKGLEAYYVEGKTEIERLAAFAKRYQISLEVDMDKSHCPICNTKLESASKEDLKNKLEPNTYQYYEQFWRCPNCGQVYWQGAHWKQIQQTLLEIKQKLAIKT